MKIGVFTALLGTLPLEDVLKKLATLNLRTVELGTGNYPGDAALQAVHADSRRKNSSSSRSGWTITDFPSAR